MADLALKLDQTQLMESKIKVRGVPPTLAPGMAPLLPGMTTSLPPLLPAPGAQIVPNQTSAAPEARTVCKNSPS